ncbi:hypothetical protein [Neisseria iguanae]|uniref:hypothetical protein n=1 Tax=Neisseria iguanae TaxID=90242 RepID=UPI001B80A7CB
MHRQQRPHDNDYQCGRGAGGCGYDPKLHEAPLVIGHPKTDAPAYGWVGGLQADGGVLSADFAQMDDDFVGLVQSGRYKKVVV